MKILLTGGLGYIGSHIANLLGSKVVIIDNKSNSKLNYKKLLPKATVLEKDLNKSSLEKVFANHNIKGVIHLAALKAVNDSIAYPLKYYQNNVSKTLELLETMDKYKIKKLIFSSSATVYGNKNISPLKENMSLQAINSYGNTKLIVEQIIDDYARSNSSFKAISLRYFNPLGADNEAGLSEQPLGEPENLMPVLIKSIKEKKVFKIFGDNYPTTDGTCIRDYIHVKDLAIAHLKALNKLGKLNGHSKINIGLGKGLSVLEIIKLFEKINKIKIKYKISNRRKGDSAISYASNLKAKHLLGWKPQYDIKDMIKDSWESKTKKNVLIADS